MEKTISIALILLLINILTAQSTVSALPQKPNALITVAQMATDQHLPIEAIILEGWLPLTSERGLKNLQHQLYGTEPMTAGEACQLTPETTLKLYPHHGDKTTLEFQLISTNLVEAEHYYQLFQTFSARWAGAQPIGVTVTAQLAEVLDDKACQYLTTDLLAAHSATLVSTAADGRYQSYAYDVAGVKPSLQVAGEAVNVNIAYVRNATGTQIYLASPLIYQSY